MLEQDGAGAGKYGIGSRGQNRGKAGVRLGLGDKWSHPVGRHQSILSSSFTAVSPAPSTLFYSMRLKPGVPVGSKLAHLMLTTGEDSLPLSIDLHSQIPRAGL